MEPQSMRILIAEDEPVTRAMLTTILRRWGYDPVAVADGDRAWEIFSGEDPPQLAIIDWMMPGLEGPELCRKVRQQLPTHPAYLILLSARDRPDDAEQGLLSGADDYVAKPFNSQELRGRVAVGLRVLALQQSLTDRVGELERTLRDLDQRTEQLHESEARLRVIIDDAPDAIITMDAGGNVKDFNPAAEAMFGWSRDEAIGRASVDLILPVEERKTGQGSEKLALREHVPFLGQRCPVVLQRRDGTTFPTELTVTASSTEQSVLFSVFVSDVSERKRLEVDLRQAQKLESVGQLAAGIAHEINTPVQFVGDNTRFLKDSFESLATLIERYRTLRDEAAGAPLGEKSLAEIERAEEAADTAYLMEEIPRAIGQSLEGLSRVATIVQAMKDFAHPDAGVKTAADLNHALRSTLTVARNEIKYVAEVHTELGELPLVECHLGDLNQVFLNLLVNAAHAIAQQVGDSGEMGQISVRSRCEGESVLISIGDTGSGIDESIREKIFDPFFTTKEVGKGTGQGLSIARSVVVDRHGGALTFETEVGKGTTFFVRLPVRSTTLSEVEAA
jgi:PAS domain S-box-containing protein